MVVVWTEDSEATERARRVALEITCDAFGHHAGESTFTEYPDGLIAARCIRCDRRITMDRVPGGVHYLRIKRLVECILNGQTESYNLIAFSEVEDHLVAEQEKLDEVKSLIALAREMINER